MWASNDLLKLKCVINKNELTCLDDLLLQAWLISICLFVTIMSPVELCVKWLFLKWFIRHKIRNQCAVEYLLHWKNYVTVHKKVAGLSPAIQTLCYNKEAKSTFFINNIKEKAHKTSNMYFAPFKTFLFLLLFLIN